MARSTLRIFAALSAVLIFAGGNAFAQGGKPAQFSRQNAKIIELFKPVVAKPAESTVSIRIDDKQVALGAIVDADGFILTKDSELRGEKIVVRFKDNKELPAKKIAKNDTWDLAMLKVDAKDLTPVSWSFSKVAPVGNWVATPGPTDAPVAIGVVSVASRTMPAGPKIALPTSSADKPFLGIQMEPTETGGVKIVLVTPKSPADKAGLKAEDVVIAIDGKDIPDLETLGATVGLHKIGDKITIRFRRKSEEKEVEATLEKRPSGFGFDRGDFQNSMGTDRSQRRTGFPVTLQHDTVLTAIQCGGPLVDIEGRVIGINIARGGRTDSYAIPAESILPLLPDLMAGKSTVAAKPPVGFADRIKAAEEALKEAEAAKSVAEKEFAKRKAALEKLMAERKKDLEKKDSPKEPEKK